MTELDFSFVADALLALCERDREAPCYSEKQIYLKMKKAQWREPFAAQLMIAGGHDVLLQEECQDVFKEARLTERQAEVLASRLEGFTFEEIGEVGGHTKQGAQSVFVQALKKLTRAFHVYRYRGLSDVYRREVRRGANRGTFGRMMPKA